VQPDAGLVGATLRAQIDAPHVHGAMSLEDDVCEYGAASTQVRSHRRIPLFLICNFIP
jgi:hypothetical protein